MGDRNRSSLLYRCNDRYNYFGYLFHRQYSFTSSSADTTWSVFVLDKAFENGARYLPQPETPALEGDGTLTIEEGKNIYILCSESHFSADAPSAATLSINYAE